MTKVQGRAEVGEAGLIETWHLGGLGNMSAKLWLGMDLIGLRQFYPII